RTAEHDEPADAPEVARRRITPGKIEVAVVDAALPEHVREKPEALGLDVPEDEPGRPLPGGVRVPTPTRHAPFFPSPSPQSRRRRGRTKFIRPSSSRHEPPLRSTRESGGR